MWMTIDQAATHLSTTRAALYKWVQRGRLRTHRLGRHLRFKQSDLDALLDTDRASEVRRATRSARSR